MSQHFVGRDELVQGLANQLTSGDNLALSAEGLPGVGKTALAIALARHRRLLEHFKDGVLWAGLGPEATSSEVLGILDRWANALGIDVTDKVEVAERKQAVEDAIGQRSFLVVIDDAWDIDVARMLRFGNPHCCHVLTTRDKGIARQFADAKQTISVLTLEDDPSFQLLQELAPEACEADPEASQALVQAAGGLPLALELLGGYLATPERILPPNLSQAAVEKMLDPRHRLQLAQERLGTPGKKITLQDTIALSIEGLCELEKGEEAERAFYALSAFAPKPEMFRWEAAKSVTDVEIEVLALLVAHNLVEGASEGMALHQVLADFAKPKLDEDAVKRHRDYYLNLVGEDRENWQRIEKVYGQIKWAWQAVPGNEELVEMAAAAKVYQERRGLWQDQLVWTTRALEVSRTYKWRKAEGALLNNIGIVYNNLGQLKKALTYYNDALSIVNETGDLEEQAKILNNIGGTFAGLGQLEEALKHYDKSLLIRENVGDRAELAHSYISIGVAYSKLGQPDKAFEYYSQALQITRAVNNRYGEAVSLHNIGIIYSELGQPDKALECFNQALFIRKEVGDLSGQAKTFNSIGMAYLRLSKYKKALNYFNKALPITEEVGDRFERADILNNIGGAYRKLGRWSKALKYYNKSLLIREETNDPVGQTGVLYNIAILYLRQGHLEKGETVLERVVELTRLIQHHEPESAVAMLAQVKKKLAAKQKS